MYFCKRCLWPTLAFSTISSIAIGQEVTKLRVVSEERIPQSVYEQVAMGGQRDTIQCGVNQSLWFPALRGYSETVSSLVRYSKKETVKIDIDSVPELAHGSIEYYSPSSDGGVLALVRSVKEYSKIDGWDNRPQKYGDSFAVKFSPQGKALSVIQLSVEEAKQPLLKLTGLAELANGWMIAGSALEGDRIRVAILLFNTSGKFRSSLALPDNVNKASYSKSAPTMSVFRPTVVVEPDGTFLVIRGFSDQPIYHISRTGELLGSIKLNPNGIIFWSPRIDGTRLFVQVGVSSPQVGELDRVPIVHPREAFSLFDLASGSLSNVLTLDGDIGGTVGCFQNEGVPRLTVVGLGIDGSDSFWTVRVLEPAEKWTTSSVL